MTAAVLGLGSIGLRHAKNLMALGQTARGFDPDSEKRERAEQEGVVACLSREAAIDGSGMVVVASPNAQHLGDTEAAIGAGCHVFVEKPLAHTDQGLSSLVETARRANLSFFVGLNQRLNPAVMATKEYLSSGKLGDLVWARFTCASYLPDWRPNTDYRANYAADPTTGGVIFDVIHEFDLAYHLCGPWEPIAVAVQNTGKLDIRSEDVCDAILHHENGVRSSVHLDYVSRPAQRAIVVVGTKGSLCTDLRARHLQVLGTDGTPVFDKHFGGSVSDDYIAEMRVFIGCTRGEAEPICRPTEAVSLLSQVLKLRAMAGLPSPTGSSGSRDA
jgi:predicted dehydrogenase